MGITFKQKGNFSKTTRFLNHLLRNDYLNFLEQCGQEGVQRLMEYTPKDTGKTANSWSYEIIEDKRKGLITIAFTNSNIVDDWCSVAIMLQYGHAVRDGSWVEGVDYINPALEPIFQKIADKTLMEITERY